MKIQTAAEVLCRVLEDPAFAESMRVNAADATKPYGLTAEETQAFFGDGTTSEAGMPALPLHAFRTISKNLAQVSAPLQQRLNLALGMHASAGSSIPCTGSRT